MPPRQLTQLKSPVPSDIDIAQSIAPQPIKDIAADIGLTDDDYDMHGKFKGKARGVWAWNSVAVSHVLLSDPAAHDERTGSADVWVDAT